METVFVATHLIMVICVTTIIWLAIFSKNSDGNAGSKPIIVQSPILLLRSIQVTMNAFYRVAIIHFEAFVK